MQDKTPIEQKPDPRKRFETVVDEDTETTIKVYPLSFREMELHADVISLILQSASAIDAAKIADAVTDGPKLWLLLAPLCGRAILRMLDDCCVPKLSECFAAPDIVMEAGGKWIALSFLRRGSFTRVMNAAGNLASAATGEKVDLASRLQSLFASVMKEKASTGAKGTTDTQTEDGQSPNSSNEEKTPVS